MFECLEAVATDAHESHNEQSQVLVRHKIGAANNYANNQKLSKDQGKLFASLWPIGCRCKHTSQISQIAPQTGNTGVETKRGQRFWWKCLNDKLSLLNIKDKDQICSHPETMRQNIWRELGTPHSQVCHHGIYHLPGYCSLLQHKEDHMYMPDMQPLTILTTDLWCMPVSVQEWLLFMCWWSQTEVLLHKTRL